MALLTFALVRELLENVNLDDMVPMDGEDGEMSEGDGARSTAVAYHQDSLLVVRFFN